MTVTISVRFPLIIVVLYDQERDTPMVDRHTGVLEGYPSRRDVLVGLAGFMLTMSLEGCAQTLVDILIESWR